MSSAPTKQIAPWAVSAPVTSFSEQVLSVTYDVGSDSDDLTFGLYGAGCEVMQDSTSSTAAIELLNEFSTPGDSGGYDIAIYLERFATDTGGYVSFSDDMGTGTIDFCVRATSYENSDGENFPVTYRETDVSLIFDTSMVDFVLLDISLEEVAPDELITEIDTGFTVAACQCEPFTCLSDPDPIKQNDPLVLCIYPLHDDPAATASVVISNFGMLIHAGEDATYTAYEPVSFGLDGWDPNSLTVVTSDQDSGASGFVMISTPIIATFYAMSFTSVSAGGSAFLEFISGGGRVDEIVEYDFPFVIGEGVTETGCIAKLFRTVGDLF